MSYRHKGRAGRPKKVKRMLNERDLGSLLAIQRKAELLNVNPRDLVEDMLKHDATKGETRLDIAMAESPLALMRAKGVLTEAQYEAGWRFAVARYRVFGRPFERAGSYSEWVGGNGDNSEARDPDRDSQNAMAYKSVWEVLHRVSRLAALEVLNATVHQRVPGWWARWGLLTIRAGDVRRQSQFFAGLNALVAYYGLEQRRVA